MTTTPVLLLTFDPQTVVVLVNTVSVAIFALIILQGREHLDLSRMAPMTVAGLLGVPVGVFILSSAGDTVLRISIVAVIIPVTVTVALNLCRSISKSIWLDIVVGFVVGVLLTSLGIGGPIMALFLLASDRSRHAIRTALATYFLIIELSGVVGYGVAGLFTAERLTLVLVVALPVLLGFGLGTVLVNRMDECFFRRTVVAVILTTSLMVLGREALSL
jgi:uncharacterized membrane protein YfcA